MDLWFEGYLLDMSNGISKASPIPNKEKRVNRSMNELKITGASLVTIIIFKDGSETRSNQKKQNFL